ncbi:MAG: sulfotransferase [Rhizobiaceae bacterium]|jgi:hypothetical protein|nr:sulfotransferase [Rhizobiaceae bacterium]
MHDLQNHGTAIINPAPCGVEATIIVLGAPRSGTSMVSKALNTMGIPMGMFMDDAVFEDRQIAGIVTELDDIAKRLKALGTPQPPAGKRFSERMLAMMGHEIAKPAEQIQRSIAIVRALVKDMRTATKPQNDDDRAALAERGEVVLKKLNQFVSRSNESNRKWGFKRPSAYETFTPDLTPFRNPRLIVPFRDPVAIAMRNVISMEFKLMPALGLAIEQTRRLAAFVQSTKVPVLLVSYEKALLDPAHFVTATAEFCGVELNEVIRRTVSATIANGDETYLQQSRLNKT